MRKGIGIAAVTLAGLMGVRVSSAAITPLNPTGWTQDMVVEAGATNDPTTHYKTNVTATLDAGTVFAAGSGADTWYEQGLNTNKALGLPAAGTITARDPLPYVFSLSVGTGAAKRTATAFAGGMGGQTPTFTLQPYTGNNAILLDATHTTATLTLATPTAYTGLVVYGSTGNGGGALANDQANLTVHFSDGTPDLTLNNAVTMGDWFGNSPIAIDTQGRVAPVTGAFDNHPDTATAIGNPRILEWPVLLSATGTSPLNTHPISSIDFNYAGSTAAANNSHISIMAVSGSTDVPEPATLGLVGLGALGLLARRRHA